ncbi:MAG TPA: hypothetical protein VIJ85_09495 [Rhizomicrobium sp.]
MLRMSVLAIAAVVLIGSRAEAQQSGGGPLPLQDMNFDMWCQEHENLPPARCDQRLPADDAKFEAYRKKIEDYEVPYLEQREQNDNLNRVIFHNDPVDHPTQPTEPVDPNPVDAPPK